MPIGPTPSASIRALVLIGINANAQSMSRSNTGTNTLLIQVSTNLTQYAVVPQGATVTLVATSSAGGSGYLNELFNGNMYNFDQYFYPISQLTFDARAPGQHILYFMLNGQPSNQVTIDVAGTINYERPSYYPYPDYYSGYYQGYYPGYYRSYQQQVSYSENIGYGGLGTSVSSNSTTSSVAYHG